MRAVFFDRDGTLMDEVGYCGEPSRVRVIQGAGDALRRLRDAGFRIVIVTNQSGIGRGYYAEADFEAVQQELFTQLGGAGLVDATYHCADAPDAHPSRRKPAPDMLLEASAALNIDLGQSFMVGDRESDIEAGHAAGCRTILVLSGHGAESANAGHVAPSIAGAARWILAQKPVR